MPSRKDLGFFCRLDGRASPNYTSSGRDLQAGWTSHALSWWGFHLHLDKSTWDGAPRLSPSLSFSEARRLRTWDFSCMDSSKPLFYVGSDGRLPFVIYNELFDGWFAVLQINQTHLCATFLKVLAHCSLPESRIRINWRLLLLLFMF